MKNPNQNKAAAAWKDTREACVSRLVVVQAMAVRRAGIKPGQQLLSNREV